MAIDWFPLWLSLRVALLSTALAFVLPPTVLGYYLLVLLGRASPLGKLWENVFGSPLVFTWKAAVVAALLHSLPLLVKSARAALESVDRSLERDARRPSQSPFTTPTKPGIPWWLARWCW